MQYTRVHRLLKLIIQIQGSPGLNCAKLAALCETSERNIYRDINMLEGAGVPVSFNPELGGYEIRRDFFLRPVELTLHEALATLLLARGVGADEQIPHLAPAGMAAEKLLAILPHPIADLVNEVMPRVTIALARSENESTADVHEKVRKAIANRRALECAYESPGRMTPPDVFRFDPYELYFGQRAWYAVGKHHGHEQVRTLKLARFTRCKATDKPYGIPDDFSLESHFGLAWRMVPSGTIYDIQLHFDAKFAETVADTHWHDTQHIDWQDDGSVLVSYRVDGLEEIIWWILGYGPHCRVLHPPELAERVRKLHGEAAGAFSS